MHGDKSQGQRERALARFERGDVEVLVATDVAARGIDVADIAHVVNFDVPGRSRLLRAPGRPHRPRRAQRRRDQLRAHRPGGRDAPHRPRPRPHPGVRAEPRPRRAGEAGEQSSGQRPQARRPGDNGAAGAGARCPHEPDRDLAKKWTCDGCGVTAGRIDGEAGAAARRLGDHGRGAASAWSAGASAPPRRRSTRPPATVPSTRGQNSAAPP